MKLPQPLNVYLRRKNGKIIAVASMEMFGKQAEGTNILKGKFPKDFKSARSMVQAWALKNSIDNIVFHEEDQTWEQ